MTRRARHEIVFHAAGGGRARTLDGNRERFAVGEAKRVASARQNDQTFERVPTVGAAAEHMQRQIDFRGRAFGEGLGQDGGRVKAGVRSAAGALWACALTTEHMALPWRFAAHCLCAPHVYQPPFFFGSA